MLNWARRPEELSSVDLHLRIRRLKKRVDHGEDALGTLRDATALYETICRNRIGFDSLGNEKYVLLFELYAVLARVARSSGKAHLAFAYKDELSRVFNGAPQSVQNGYVSRYFVALSDTTGAAIEMPGGRTQSVKLIAELGGFVDRWIQQVPSGVALEIQTGLSKRKIEWNHQVGDPEAAIDCAVEERFCHLVDAASENLHAKTLNAIAIAKWFADMGSEGEAEFWLRESRSFGCKEATDQLELHRARVEKILAQLRGDIRAELEAREKTLRLIQTLNGRD